MVRPPGPGGPPDDPAADMARQQADQELLARGRLPLAAERRLRGVGGADPDGLAFTGDLSAGEAALVRRQGLEPLCLVTGNALYHVGFASASAWQDCEVSELSHAYDEATRLAVRRLELEAQTAGAHGVVGVRYAIARHEWAEHTVEVQVMGTAVRTGGPRPKAPWLSDLSGQQWWALWQVGYQALALVWGHCTWFVLTTQQDEWNEWNPQNVELRHFSAALGQCRNRAAMRMQAMARAAGALGVVGVHLARRLDEVRLTGGGDPATEAAVEREHHNLSFSAIGTAVGLRPNAPRHIVQTPLVLSLRDGRLGLRGTPAEASFS